ncbi:MAG: 2-amino-4-hydroxy-6-hydroxymethyldihydropteridine diphosphokinase [Bacteroidetes bacterium]|nr:2-amino-4-hydroxy-6-hydroxymethyldihydropteridine diphosphokinase [Bacteroidota bacterium]
MKEVFILSGSNRGDRQGFISKATDMIEQMAGAVVRKSSVYETSPWGFDDPTPFLNQVIEIETMLSPEDLLEILLTIEVKLGRIRPFDGCGCGIPASPDHGTGKKDAPAYAGRTIDLDILFYGQRLIFTDKLMVPHPRLHERAFTLVPLNEVVPEFVHPLLKKTIAMLLHECRDQAKVKKMDD